MVLPLIFPGSSFTNTFSVFRFILNLTNFCHLSSSGRRKRCPTLNVYQLLLAFWHYLLLCLILNLSTCLSMHMLDFCPPEPAEGSLVRATTCRLPGHSGGWSQRQLAQYMETPRQITGQTARFQILRFFYFYEKCLWHFHRNCIESIYCFG